MLELEVQYATSDPIDVPVTAKFESWAEQVSAAINELQLNPSSNDLPIGGASFGLTLRIVDEKEMIDLNSQFRGKPRPTNVLSFPFEPIPQLRDESNGEYLGDIVVCHAVVRSESMDQGKELEAHWAHLVVHGILHLFGYDHVHDYDALEMEDLERKILSKLGFGDPYA